MRIGTLEIQWQLSFTLVLCLGLFFPSSTVGQTDNYMYPLEWEIGHKWTYTVVREGLSDCLSCEVPTQRHKIEVVVTGKKSGPIFDTLAFRVKVDTLQKNSNVSTGSNTGNGNGLFHRSQRGFWSREIPEFMGYSQLPMHRPCLDSAQATTRKEGNSLSTLEVHVDTLSTSKGLRKAIANKSTSNTYGSSEIRMLCVEGWGNVYGFESEFTFPGGYKETWVLNELVLSNQAPIPMDAEKWYAKVMERPVPLFSPSGLNQVRFKHSKAVKPLRDFNPVLLGNVNPLGRKTSEF